MMLAPLSIKSPMSPIDGFHHQVHVHGRRDAVFAQRVEHQRPDGQVGHVVIVHDVKVDNVCACVEHGGDLFAKAGEVGGED